MAPTLYQPDDVIIFDLSRPAMNDGEMVLNFEVIDRNFGSKDMAIRFAREVAERRGASVWLALPPSEQRELLATFRRRP